MSDHLLLLDASGFAHRAHYASLPRYRDDGLPISAILGFMGMTWSLLQRALSDPPTLGAAVFDFPAKTFRHRLFKDYKANRSTSQREELMPQLDYMRHAALALGLTPVEAKGFEGDDVIATLATHAAKAGIRTTICSQDKDFCGLVRDGVIEIIEPVSRKRLLSADVKRKFGVAPDLVWDAQALSGDVVDNIPGIDGIGGKTAGALIRQYGGLEPLLKAASQSGRSVGTPAIRKALRQGADAARLYKKLATLDTRVPGLPSVDSLVLHKPDISHLKEMLRVLGEQRLFGIMFGGDPALTIRLPHVPAPLVWWHGIPKDGVTALGEIPRDPQDGYFKTRLVRGGPCVPARIFRDEEKDFVTGKLTGFDIVKCEINGKAKNPLREWLQLARMPITKADFDHRVAVSDWAKKYDPNSSEANEDRAIDWLTQPL